MFLLATSSGWASFILAKAAWIGFSTPPRWFFKISSCRGKWPTAVGQVVSRFAIWVEILIHMYFFNYCFLLTDNTTNWRRDLQQESDMSTLHQCPTCRGSPSCELDERAQGKLIASPSLSSQSADPGGFVPASIFERDLITPPLIQGPGTG